MIHPGVNFKSRGFEVDEKLLTKNNKISLDLILTV